MVRTLSECKGTKAGGKASRKSGVLRPGSSSTVKTSKAKSTGGNPYCPRPTPDWQKPIVGFLKLNDQSTSGKQSKVSCSAASEQKGIDYGLDAKKDISEAGPSNLGVDSIVENALCEAGPSSKSGVFNAGPEIVGVGTEKGLDYVEGAAEIGPAIVQSDTKEGNITFEMEKSGKCNMNFRDVNVGQFGASSFQSSEGNSEKAASVKSVYGGDTHTTFNCNNEMANVGHRYEDIKKKPVGIADIVLRSEATNQDVEHCLVLLRGNEKIQPEAMETNEN